jgi:BlaI family penicillinase repressor
MKKKKTPSVPTVTPAEWEIMESLWKNGAQAARDIYASLSNSWDIKTVRSLLSRLVEKGAVGYDQIGNSYLYRAEFSRESLACGEVQSIVDRTLGGSIPALFATFLREEKLDDAEIEELRKILHSAERRQP